MRCLVLIALLMQILAAVEPTLTLAGEGDATAFPLVRGQAAALVSSPEDAEVVRLALAALAQDIRLVTGVSPDLRSGAADVPPLCVLAGTLGHSPLIDGLAAKERIPGADIRGQWERHLMTVVDDPLPGVKRALVIAGSDRRGTAYGIFALSRLIGVSPWVWWADVAPAHRGSLLLSAGSAVSGSPAVRYRGIFLNDEDWGLQPWAARTQDPDLKDIGPHTYARIFELLLRLRGNLIWPAMHPCTKAFYHYPGNPDMADRYAIVVGSSHCEQMLRNNVDEWKRFTTAQGTPGAEFRYDTNVAQVDAYWRERVAQSIHRDSIYTLGMRGLHDGHMIGPKTMEEKVATMGRAVDSQRAMLEQAAGRPAATVPQIFCPYKEVLDIYRAGFKVPDDVTLVWPDDNHGYIRQLSSPEEQRRTGGSGVYYHLSYWGAPADYLWLCSTAPGLIAHELHKALATGADRLWVFNVGDIKPAELETEFALDLAWDPATWTPEAAPRYVRAWAARTFGEPYAERIAALKAGYYRLAQAAKPEHVWQVAFSRGEAESRIAAYAALRQQAEALHGEIPAALRDAYFQLILYPIAGAARMNEKVLGAKLGRLAEAEAAYRDIPLLTERYNAGPWQGIMSWNPRAPRGNGKGPKAFEPAAFYASADGGPRLAQESWHPVADLSRPEAKADRDGAAIRIWPGLGSEVGVGRTPLVGPALPMELAPWVEYAVPVSPGSRSLRIRFLPTHAIHAGLTLRVGLSVAGGAPTVHDLETAEFSAPWSVNVLRGAAEVILPCPPGVTTTTVRVILPDPGVVLTGLQSGTAAPP